MADLTRIIELIENEVDALGFALVRVKMTGSGEERTLQIMAEDPATGQMIMEQCARLSRAISEKIDAVEEAGEELVEGAYLLEVSSPGIDRPLTRPQDYGNWEGHSLNLSLKEPINDLRKLRGELVGIEDGIVTVEDKREGRISVPYTAIHSAKLVLTDKLIAATQPLDAEGADEIEEVEETTEEEKA